MSDPGANSAWRPDLPLVGPEDPIRCAAEAIDRLTLGIAVVVDDRGRVSGTVTDGDIRRAMLAGWELDNPIRVVLERKRGASYERPVTAPVGTSSGDLLRLMRDRAVRQVPLVDDAGRPVAIATVERLATRSIGPAGAAALPEAAAGRSSGPMTAVVMAGGKGLRLRPLTESTPKPMLRVGGRPLLEHTVERLVAAGIGRIAISVNYLAEQIRAHFGDGSSIGAEIRYLEEPAPLGTAGCLSMLTDEGGGPGGPVLVLNGDILTSVDFGQLRRFHDEQAASMTVAVRRHSIAVPYGVAECDGAVIRSLVEKPTYTVLVNAGIYLLEPRLLGLIPSGRRFDMTQLIEAARAARPGGVCAFPIREYWLDIGRPADFERAVREGPAVMTAAELLSRSAGERRIA